MLLRTTTALSCLALLSACGGSGGSGVSTVPILNLGFAGEDTGQNEITPVATLVDSRRIVEDDNSQNTRFEAQDIVVTVDTETDLYTVELDGVSYELTSENGSALLTFDRDGDYVELDLFSEADSSSAFELFSVVDGKLNTGYIVLGRDTSPAVIDEATGTATFRGEVDVVLYRDNFEDAFGSGSFEMTADFSSNNISGSAEITDDMQATSEFNFDPITLSLDQTRINENGFSGGISVTSGDINGTLVDGGYDGRFFGEDADAVGGNLYGQIDTDDNANDTFVSGYFLGDAAEE